MNFRQDINGLRAIAVMAVALYHFDVSGFSGGFAGVDIFFVISGYLMTGIIMTAQEQGRFSVLSFFAARCRRIIPALLALCATLLGLGWFLLPPTDYTELAVQVAVALTFTANVHFYSDSNYFSLLAQEKLLLHTWSLAVEWQFYLVFPFVILALLRLQRARPKLTLVRGLLALSILSLFCSIAVVQVDRDFAFYLLPARLWELSAGGLVYLLMRNHALWQGRQQVLMQVAGVALIAISIVLFSSKTLWPGISAVLPVAGTCLVLAAAGKNRLLDAMPVQVLGRWSYSIYLWHWPLVVFHYMQILPDPVWPVTGVAGSIALGALSYRFIEVPAKNRRGGARLLASLLLITVLASGAVAVWQGMPSRTSAAVQLAEQEIGNIYNPKKSCILKQQQPPLWKCGADTPRFVVWGDSHALALVSAVSEAAGGATGELYTQSCPPLADAYLDQKRSNRRCQRNTDIILSQLAALPENMPVIIAFRYSYYLYGHNEDPTRDMRLRFLKMTAEEQHQGITTVFANRLEDTLCRVGAQRSHVYAVLPVPEMGFDVPRLIARERMAGHTAMIPGPTLQAYQQRNSLVIGALERAAKRCGITLLDPAPLLCPGGVCLSEQQGRPLYGDDDHLSESGNKLLVPLLRPVFAP